MNFVHNDPEFDALIRIVAAEFKIDIALVEKDYWVTHTLWALGKQGFELWLKGGTSLSKGFNLIKRFSEDLDLKVEPGRVDQLQSVRNWKSKGKTAIAERKLYFKSLEQLLSVPGAEIHVGSAVDERYRNANFHIIYPGIHLTEPLKSVLHPFVLLEVGSARVSPYVECDLTSFVHSYLEENRQIEDFDDNRPYSLRCVHPMITLLEKLDALIRRVPREDSEPATFVRHFEDAAQIVKAVASLPSLSKYPSARALAEEMLNHKQIVELPSSTNEAFAPVDNKRWKDIHSAYRSIEAMFWGPRLSLKESCNELRQWISAEFG